MATLSFPRHILIVPGLLFSASLVLAGRPESGASPMYRNMTDTRQNATTIANPSDNLAPGGLLTGIMAYMLNTKDCIRIEVWRPAIEASVSHDMQTTTRSYTTIPYPQRSSYWILVGQSSKCLRGEVANQTFVYNLPSDEYIRYEVYDVIGFSFRQSNPIPYDLTGGHCGPWKKSLTTQSSVKTGSLRANVAYSFIPLPECRVYSLSVALDQRDCKRLIPQLSAQNITFTSTGRTSVDECWRIDTVGPIKDLDSPTIIYLKYFEFTSSNCDVANVEIREGGSSSSMLIQRDCKMPNPLRADIRPISSGQAYVRFRQRARATRPVTFVMQYSTTRATESTCREVVVTENPAFIRSPEYPNHYPPNTNICWKLRIVDGSDSRIRVELGKGLDLQPPVGCKRTETYNSCNDRNCKDYVEVRDGGDRSSALITKWCDHTGYDLIETSSGQTLTIYFTSDDSIQGKGFQFKTYSVHPETIQCSHYIAMYEPQLLQSPYYPYRYPDGRDDCWSVRANNKHKRVLVSVKDSSLEVDVVCAKDWIEIRDGPGRSAPLLQRWCGHTIPSDILSSGPQIYVRFVSNDMGRYTGFSLAFAQQSSQACTTYYAYSHREYLQPDLGQTATGYDIRCWVIRAELGKIRIQWDSSPTDTGGVCGNTYVEIHNGESVSAPLLGKYCASQPIPPQGVESDGDAIYIRWVSDANTRPATFRLYYMSLASNHCPLVFSAERPLHLNNPLPGMTTTAYPYYFRTTAKPARSRPQPLEPCKTCKYGPNQQRCWTVETERPGGRNLVVVRFVELQGKDDRGQCKYDFLELRDGQTGDSPLLAMLCGSEEQRNYTTTSRWLFVRFQSDSQIELRGFRLEVTGIWENECITYQAQNYGQTIRSPYPGNYPPNTQKCWTIRSSSLQQPIKVLATSITLGIDDVIEFYDGSSSDAALLHKFDFHTKNGAEVISSGNKMNIILRTGAKATSRGYFNLRYNWVYTGTCTHISVREKATYITTRDYGSKNYSVNDYACWKLTVLDPQHTIEILSDTFHLEEGPTCSSDYLEIYDGPQKSEEKFLHRWCGKRSNQLLARSSGRSLYMVFRSDGQRQFSGFKLKISAKKNLDSASAGGVIGGSLNSLLVIIIPVVAVFFLLIIIIIAVVICCNRKRESTNSERSAAPVVVYTNQPPAYSAPPVENGAVGNIPEEHKVPLPDDDPEPATQPSPPISRPQSTTADTSKLV